jgi:hypothetical protein
MTLAMHLKPICLCPQRCRCHLLCCHFMISRLKILVLLAPFAAWPWGPWYMEMQQATYSLPQQYAL